MDGLDEYLSVLQKLPLRRKQGLLARCVMRAALESASPPDFLYATTSAGRYNPENVESIYWSEDETVARFEYRRYHKGAETYETFFCRYSVHVVDLGDSNVVSALGLNSSDLWAHWRTASTPTKCQILGQAISRQKRFAAIRFRSDAARVAGETGFNYVVFKASICDPSFIQVETDPGVPIQRWPMA
jgi:RES domain-containing protein